MSEDFELDEHAVRLSLVDVAVICRSYRNHAAIIRRMGQACDWHSNVTVASQGAIIVRLALAYRIETMWQSRGNHVAIMRQTCDNHVAIM